jgi:drug/metabolite transporter (DMT)-like permease
MCWGYACILRIKSTQGWPSIYSVKFEIVVLNLFTLASFFLYFLAIQSPIGSALNSLIAYGAGPIFTAVIGAALVREHLRGLFAVSAGLSLVGLVMLESRRFYAHDISWDSLNGTVFALLSSLTGAVYLVYFKVLLQKGIPKSAIVLTRLMGLSVVLGSVLLVHPDLFQWTFCPRPL